MSDREQSNNPAGYSGLNSNTPYLLKPDTGCSHTIIITPARSGKSFFSVIPLIWPDPREVSGCE